MRKVKALILLSGGLDSILAAKILKSQEIKVSALSFKSYFFNAENAKKAAKNLKIPIRIIDFSKEHLKIVKSPKHGYGRFMNPCIDCHILMLKKAKEIMEKEKYDPAPEQARYGASFIATGEVLGQRPMSQHRTALNLIEKESDLKGFLLRPLSAKLLNETVVERTGLVNRSKLFDVSGRSRKRQIALAKKWKIKSYPTPAGGCLLTEAEFGKRLKELFKICPKCNGNDIKLLKLGRHFCFTLSSPKGEGGSWVKIIVGRNHKENLNLKRLAQKNDILIEMENYPGPTTLIRDYNKNKIAAKIIKKAKILTKYYSPKARNKKDIKFKIDFFEKNR